MDPRLCPKRILAVEEGKTCKVTRKRFSAMAKIRIPVPPQPLLWGVPRCGGETGERVRKSSRTRPNPPNDVQWFSLSAIDQALAGTRPATPSRVYTESDLGRSAAITNDFRRSTRLQDAHMTGSNFFVELERAVKEHHGGRAVFQQGFCSAGSPDELLRALGGGKTSFR